MKTIMKMKMRSIQKPTIYSFKGENFVNELRDLANELLPIDEIILQ